MITAQDADNNRARRIADYERLSAIFWLIIGIIQICCLVTALAGIWNVLAAISRFKIAPRILARDKTIPEDYKSLSGYIVIGAINLFFGGVVGVVLICFDLYLRDQILSHSYIFDGTTSPASAGLRANTIDFDALERLFELREKGILTEEEFQVQKARIL